MQKYFSFVMISLALSSCTAFHSGNISTGSYIDCPYSHVIKGKAYTTKIFGIGGLRNNTLISNAKIAMYEDNPIYKGLKVSNFAVDFKTSYIFFYSKTEVTVSADVFDCDKTIPDRPSASELTETIIREKVNGFSIGDSVLIQKTEPVTGVVTSQPNTRRIGVSYREGENSRTKLYYYPQVFKTNKADYNKQYFGYEIGEIVTQDIFSVSKQTYVPTKCIVKGINKQTIAVQDINETNSQKLFYFDNKRSK